MRSNPILCHISGEKHKLGFEKERKVDAP